MNKSKFAAVLLLAASLAAACVTRWSAEGPAAVVSGPPSSSVVSASLGAAPLTGGSPAGVVAGSYPSEREGVRSVDVEVGAAEVSGFGLDLSVGSATSPLQAAAGIALGIVEAVVAEVAVAQPIEMTAQVPAVAEAALGSSAIRMPFPFRTQKDGDRFQGSNCGPAALGMILDAFGVARGNADLRFLSHTYQGTVGARTGTALQHIAHVAADLGLEPRGLYQRPDRSWGKEGFARWTVEDIRAEVLAGRPVVPLVKFRLLPGHEDSPFRADHYVVIHGVDGDQFLYHDPIYESPWEGGAKWMSDETLAAAMRPTLVPQQAVSFGSGRFAVLPALR
jgi:hypothetical protein